MILPNQYTGDLLFLREKALSAQHMVALLYSPANHFSKESWRSVDMQDELGLTSRQYCSMRKKCNGAWFGMN